MRKLILITGCPASGKTTFAKKLSSELNIPYFSKDLIKISLAEYIQIAKQEESTRLSKATVSAMLSIAESLMSVEQPFILEANFRQHEGNAIDKLLTKYDYRCLTYFFGGDFKVLGKRFVERDFTSERHKANRMFNPVMNYDEYEELFKEYRMFTTGDHIVPVDTTSFDGVDFDELMQIAVNELA